VRLPDGLRLPVRLRSLLIDGVESWKQWSDEEFAATSLCPANPWIVLRLTPALRAKVTPIGTEIWFDPTDVNNEHDS
jgi:hypothetical protein